MGSSLRCWVVAWGLQSWRAQQLSMASVALRHVGSSQTRGWTCVPYTARQLLNHWTTRQVPIKCILSVEFDEFWSMDAPMCMFAAQSWLTLCNPKDCSPPGSSVYVISHARILEWVGIPFSRGSSWPRDGRPVSRTAVRFVTEPSGKPIYAAPTQDREHSITPESPFPEDATVLMCIITNNHLKSKQGPP